VTTVDASSRFSHHSLANHAKTVVANVLNHKNVPQKKVNFPFKTTKISNLTMKEARTLLIEVAASSADLIQRWDHSVLKGDVNIVGVASILPRQIHERKSELSF
jgi:hypothetical protein